MIRLCRAWNVGYGRFCKPTPPNSPLADDEGRNPGNALITLLDWLHLDLPLMGFTDGLRRRRGVYPAPEFQLIAGVEEMLLALAPHYPLALVTTRSRYHIDQFLLRFPN